MADPGSWWPRGGVRPYLLLTDIVAFVIATVITSPTSPVHAVVLLVYLIVFYVAGLYRSRWSRPGARWIGTAGPCGR